MVNTTRFAVGSRGSSKHTESRGDGSQMGGRPPSVGGPRVGPGSFGTKVSTEVNRNITNGEKSTPKRMSRDTEE